MSSSSVDEVEAQSEEHPLLGHGRSPHPELMLKAAIAYNDGTPTRGWMSGLYSKEAFEFLKSIHERIAASTLEECDAQVFYEIISATNFR